MKRSQKGKKKKNQIGFASLGRSNFSIFLGKERLAKLDIDSGYISACICSIVP